MPLSLKGTTSGQVTLTVPAVAGSGTLTLPTTTDTVATLTSNTFVTPTLTSPIVSGNLTLNGSSSGTIAVAAPATASGTVTFPAGTGTVAVQGVSTNIVSGTAQNSTSGTSIDFTGIPSWAKRITVMFNAVSITGTSNYLVQIGNSGGVETTGYVSQAQATNTTATSTAGFIQYHTSTIASNSYYGQCVLALFGSNTWIQFSGLGSTPTVSVALGTGAKTLSTTLDRVRITTVNGTDTFDAGSINIVWE